MFLTRQLPTELFETFGIKTGNSFILILNPEVSEFRISYALQQVFNNFVPHMRDSAIV